VRKYNSEVIEAEHNEWTPWTEEC